MMTTPHRAELRTAARDARRRRGRVGRRRPRPPLPRLPGRVLGAELRAPPPAARRGRARAARPAHAHEPRVRQRPARTVLPRARRPVRHGSRAADEHRRRGGRDRDQGRAALGLRSARASRPTAPRSSCAPTTSTAARRRSSASRPTPTRATASVRSRPGSSRFRSATPHALRAAITENTVAFLVEPVQGEAGVIVPPRRLPRRGAAASAPTPAC